MNQLITKIVNHKSETIFGAGLVTASLSLVSGLLGVLRNALLAWRFGASANLDIYYASFRLPDLIYNVFIMGAISVAFIPVFSSWWHKDREKAQHLASATIVFTGIILGIMSLLIAIFARPILAKLLVGFDSRKLNIAVALTRIMMIQPVLLGISSIIAGLLRFFKLFFISAVAPVMYNLGIIIGIVWGVPLFGLPGLAYGVVLGAVLHLIIQLPSFYHLGGCLILQPAWLKEIKTALKKMIALIGPRLLGIVSYQLFLVGITTITTLLKEGSLSVLNFAVSIQNLPQNIFVLPLAIAAFPRLSDLYAQHRNSDFVIVLKNTLSQILFLLFPLAVWIYFFRQPIIRLLLGYGKFDWQDTLLTTQVLRILVGAMIFSGINLLLLRVFFARKDTISPLIASVISYPLGLYISYYWGLKQGITGVAGGIVLTNILNFAILFFLLKRKSRFNFGWSWIKKISIILVISCLSGLLGYGTFKFLISYFTADKVVNLAGVTAVSLLISGITYYYLSLKCKIEEAQFIQEIIKRRRLL